MIFKDTVQKKYTHNEQHWEKITPMLKVVLLGQYEKKNNAKRKPERRNKWQREGVGCKKLANCKVLI
jgi:hypothetical protein